MKIIKDIPQRQTQDCLSKKKKKMMKKKVVCKVACDKIAEKKNILNTM